MSKNSDAVKAWRKRTKKRLIESFGGACGLCGYNACFFALDFHHINPKEKKFSLANGMAHATKWENLVEEVRKCICICRNCHMEIHYNNRKIPKNIIRFNESYAEYQEVPGIDLEPCPVCGKDKPKTQINCSRSCAGKTRGKVNWDNINLIEMLKTHNNNLSEVGRILGVSASAVLKRKRKLHSLAVTA